MATKVYMEALSPTMEEGRLVSWVKNQGDPVTNGDVLAEVETDKAIMELQARGEGVLLNVLAAEDSTVEVGTLLAVIGETDEDVSDILAAAGAAPEVAEAKPETAAGEAPSDAPRSPSETRTVGGTRIKSSPLARRLARERRIDLGAITGSGPGGRIVVRDVEAAEPAPRLPVALEPEAEFNDVGLSQLRKTIAKRLSSSIGPIPHFFLTSEIDMERTWEARVALNDVGDEQRISFNDIIIKVVAEALRLHPECNGWWHDDSIRYFRSVHIGMAVAIDDGLITPVIRNVPLKSLREIAKESNELARRARERKLMPEEYTGGTFSISNLGMFDIDQFTAVINPPEAGILAVGSIQQKPVVEGGEVVVRRRLRVTMSCDHRIIDGATGARFLQTVKRMLENPLAIVW
jgi:pyruvate dehydrogenase E2 component (dihydrolipoamide acetyltransferase)